jgi:spermidine synthase
MIMMAQFVFGPFQETFAMVLFVVLLGIALGSALVHLRPVPFGVLLAGAMVSVLLVLGLFGPLVRLYAVGRPSFAGDALVSWRILILLLIMAPASICFGAAVPALVKREGHVSKDSGELLYVSSLANVAGYLLMVFVLHERFEYGEILAVVAVLLAAGLALYSWPMRRPILAAAALLALPLPVLGRAWDEDLLYGSHTDFESLERLERRRAERNVEHRFRRYEEAFSVLSYRGDRYLFFNGYYSTEINYLGEHAVGIMSVLVSPRLDEALVLGLGTGSTAGSVAQYFGRTDVVEISPLIIEHQDLFEGNSFALLRNPNATIVCDDGIRFLKRADARYDLIVNTVTNPQHFSSSKLYTRDFFRRVKEHLAPDGVYTTWIGTSVGNRGTQIILKTLRSEFRYCWVGVIRSHYLLLLCSNEPLALRQEEAVVANERVRRYFAERGTDLALLRYCFVCDDAYRALKGARGIPLNTLDRPELEFEIARVERRDATTLGRLRRTIKAHYDPERLNRTIFRTRPLDPLELVLYYEELSAPLYDRRFFRRVAARELGIDERELLARLREALLESRRRAAREFRDSWTLARYAETLAEMGRLEEAAAAFEEAVEELDPADPPPRLWIRYGRTLERLHRLERACLLYREQTARTPRWATAHYCLGRVQFQLRRLPECIRSLRTCLELDPDYEEANAYLGRCYLLLGERERARAYFERELAIDPNDAEVLRLLATLRPADAAA